MSNGVKDGASPRRVMIFIDGSNLYHVLKQNTDKHDLDYKKFAEKLCGDRQLIRTYYYNIRQESSDNPRLAENQDRFLNALYETEYLEVRLGIWKARGHTMVEKGVDVMIASDLITHAYEDHYDTAILVSGDADFYPALQAVKDVGKQVEVAAFDSNLSSEAARFSDVLLKFNNSYFDDLWMSNGMKSQLSRTAALRRSVSDEAASPNGEDKGSTRPTRRDTRESSNGRVSSRRTESRRRVGSQQNGATTGMAGRYSTPARDRSSGSSNRHRTNGRPNPPAIRRSTAGRRSISSLAEKSGRQDSPSRKSGNAIRESWVSRMFRSRS